MATERSDARDRGGAYRRVRSYISELSVGPTAVSRAPALFLMFAAAITFPAVATA